jgi:hypothetical protein
MRPRPRAPALLACVCFPLAGFGAAEARGAIDPTAAAEARAHGGSSEPAESQDDEPGRAAVVAVGTAMAVGAYFLALTWHEGAHALTVESMGGDVTRFSILPFTRSGNLHFGETKFVGCSGTEELALVFLAPKAVDLLLLGGYTALLETDTLPANRWARLALGVVAAAAWVDFSQDTASTNPANDMVRFYELVDARGAHESLPYRLVQGAIAVAAGIEVARGLYQVLAGRRRGAGPSPERSIVPVVGPETVGVAVRF